MRTAALLIFVAACADGASGDVDYDHVAQLLGTSIATPEAGGETGALADAAIIARGGLPVGFENEHGIVVGLHDGTRYVYMVVCEDTAGASTPCSPVAARAFAIAEWSSPQQKRTGIWTLEHLQGAVASVTGGSSFTHTDEGLDMADDRNEAFLLDLGSYEPRSGTIATDLAIDDTKLSGTIQMTTSRIAMLTLPGHVYQIDLDTGEVVPGQILR